MTKKIVALLDTDEAVNEAVDKLGKQPEDAFDWRLLRFNNESQRLVPISGSATDRGGSVAAAAAAPAMGRAVVQPEVAQGEIFVSGIREDLGISDEEARYFAQGVQHGGQVAVIKAPDDGVDAARQLLEGLGGQGIMVTDG